MGRPEPCILFAQSFVHPQLDEYFDEVIFTEPVVITACEFLEQNASSASPLVTINGATSPPSFALEVFVHCEGEPRFRRLCQPFLYSHSSSNVLEVEAVVTTHLVVRGSYRSLTLVVYGNTAEDLGQFNIEYDLDSSLANLVCSPSEGKLEDLPTALHGTKQITEESITSLKSLSLPTAEPDLSVEMKQFLHLTLKICQLPNLEDAFQKFASIIVSAVSSCINDDLRGTAITWNQYKQDNLFDGKMETQHVLTEARNELLEIYKMLQHAPGNVSGEGVFEVDSELNTTELLGDVFNQCSLFKMKLPMHGLKLLSKNENMIIELSMILLLCSGRESCFHFVNGGGMEQLVHLFCREEQRSNAITLILLGVVERATRHAIGCEGFLGWWPREDENVPIGSSEGYNHLLKLLLQKQCHDVASLATYVLHRLRLYEVAARFESAVLNVLGSLSAVGTFTNASLKSLATANSQLKKLLKLLNLRGPIEDPSPPAYVARSLLYTQSEGFLSYGATISFVKSSKYCSAEMDIDRHLLYLLKETGFLPLAAALLSSPLLHSENGNTMDVFVDIASFIEAILLSFLFCRSGSIYLLSQLEVTAALILALKGAEDTDMAVCVPLRFAAVLILKGFLCRTQEIGMIIELHLRVVNAIDRLLSVTVHSEELLWILWELCAISRSDSGRQALLALRHFPEAVLVLLESLQPVKELPSVASNNGTSPLSVATFHSAAELFEVMVTDSTASSLASWIGHAVDLHKALHSSSPGSNRKDAPTRLLEWIDAGVVYHRKGALGLLRYAAVLASGGDAHLSSTSILVSDSMDVENVVGDSASGSDIQVIENLLGKLVSDKFFDGVTLRDSSIAQLTTALRILAFISENPAVAISLYEEGAVTLIYVVLINCKFMLERSSKTYDYLVDEGAECNSTSDLLLERSHEQSLIDLLIPSLILLITLLQKLQEAKEQHRNTKLLNALLRLHREVSPKLAACAADISSPYPRSALGLGTVCRLIASTLAFWPVFSWTPGLFHCLLESVQATSLLALGPKEACSLLCLLGDLFPEEGLWEWKNGMPSLSALRTLGVATLLGPQKEKDVDWYLQPGHLSLLLSRLAPLLDKIAEIILHFAFTALVVIQDMLRVFIIRIACQREESALILLRPIISWLHDNVSKSTLSDTDVFKVHQLLNFVSILLEHPRGKALLLKARGVGVLIKALERCSDTFSQDGKLTSENRTKTGLSLLSWCLPVLKSLTLIYDSQAPLHLPGVQEKCLLESLSDEDCSVMIRHLLKLCQVLPVGKELLACLSALKEMASSSQGQRAFISGFAQIQSSAQGDLESRMGREIEGSSVSDEYDWKGCSSLLSCWKNLLGSLDVKDGHSIYAMDAVNVFCLGAFSLCAEGKNVEGTLMLKCLFGIPHDLDVVDDCPEENLKDVHELLTLLELRSNENDFLEFSNAKTPLQQVKEHVKSLLLLLQKPAGSTIVENVQQNDGCEHLVHSKIFPLHPSILSHMDEEAGLPLSRIRKSDGNTEKAGPYFSFGGLTEKFLWECPDSSPDRLPIPSLPVKRKLTSIEGSSRRIRGDNIGTENIGMNTFSRGLGTPATASNHTRRDTFRQRKPNTSRPPSMHVDDYVARERNVDSVTSGSNVVNSSQRGGSTGGRPPSIHVDEFMARQRERQNPSAMVVGEVALVRNSPLENDNDSDKPDRSQQLKAGLDDDLQEIDIVFDEESESDDRLPFPQPDDNLLSAPVIIGESSPRSIVEETENDIDETTQLPPSSTPTPKVDGSSHAESSLRRSGSRSEMPLTRESSVSSDNFPRSNSEKAFFHEQIDKKHPLPLTASKDGDASTKVNVHTTQLYKDTATSSVPSFRDARLPPPPFYQWENPQHTFSAPTMSPGHFDLKPPYSQPPLPPLPPPSVVSAMPVQTPEPVQNHSSPYGHSVRDMQPPSHPVYSLQMADANGPNMVPAFSVREERPSVPTSAAGSVQPPSSSSAFPESLGHPFQSQLYAEYQSISGSNSMVSSTPYPMPESKYSWASVSSSSRLHDETSTSGGSGRPLQPPLPPTPPPYSASSVIQSAVKNLAPSSIYTNPGAQIPPATSYTLPPFVPLPSKPAAVPGTPFSSTSMQQQGQNPPSVLHPIPSPQSVQSVQPRPPLLPLQPPLPPHPPQPPRPPAIQASQQQLETGIPLQQGHIQLQAQPLQIQHHLHIPQMHVYYQPQQQEPPSQPQQQQVENAQPHIVHQQGDGTLQQQQEAGATLQQHFSSPEAIQSLLSDREKLCQLLEQHPKLMQMLQEKLGQL